MKIKIAQGLARWKVQKGGRDTTEMGFYGQVYDVPEKEAQRLLSNGVAVEADKVLERPGMIMPLPNTASDAEIRAWVAVANQDEIDAVKEQRPDIADRIDDAVAHVTGSAAASKTGADAGQPPAEPNGGDGTQGQNNADDAKYDEVVQGNVGEVSEYLSKNPADAQAVLAAENRRVQAEGLDGPRKGVLEAVQIAASSAQ